MHSIHGARLNLSVTVTTLQAKDYLQISQQCRSDYKNFSWNYHGRAVSRIEPPARLLALCARKLDFSDLLIHLSPALMMLQVLELWFQTFNPLRGKTVRTLRQYNLQAYPVPRWRLSSCATASLMQPVGEFRYHLTIAHSMLECGSMYFNRWDRSHLKLPQLSAVAFSFLVFQGLIVSPREVDHSYLKVHCCCVNGSGWKPAQCCSTPKRSIYLVSILAANQLKALDFF